MLFTVKTEKGTVNLDKNQLVDMLLGEVIESSKKEPRPDMMLMSISFNELLQSKKVYTQMSLDISSNISEPDSEASV